MRITAVKNVSAIALLAALAVTPFTETFAQSSNASERGQEMGQGTPGGSNPNAGPGNNSGQGNTMPGATGEAMSGNSNAGPGNNSANGNTSPGTPRSDSGASTQTPGPDSGHNCGGQGHIDNDAPGHQHDDCEATGIGSTGAMRSGGAAVANRARGVNQAAPGQVGANAGGASGFATADCSMTEGLTPPFGALTQQEVQVLSTADQAAVVVVVCPEVSTSPEAQQAVAQNPGITRALEAQGFGVHQVIAADAGEPVPTIYVEAASTN